MMSNMQPGDGGLVPNIPGPNFESCAFDVPARRMDTPTDKHESDKTEGVGTKGPGMPSWLE